MKTIEMNRPDVVLLVEYARQHDDAMRNLLKRNYPYINRFVGGKHFDGDVIYSRYPLTKINHEVVPGSRSFTHIQIKNPLNKEITDFALVHTSAPISPSFWKMRETQLNKLQTILSAYYNNKNDLSKRGVVLL